jgi:hypothetical protein
VPVRDGVTVSVQEGVTVLLGVLEGDSVGVFDAVLVPVRDGVTVEVGV